jgi:ParB-like chromosome segregation protein Spo0J
MTPLELSFLYWGMGLAEFREVPVDSLRPHPLNEKLYPVNEEEDEDLKESMERSGLLEPIVALPDGTIISGTRRWRVAQKLGWKAVTCEFRSFEDPELAILEYNKYRKKTPRIIKNEYDLLKEKLAPKAKERQEATQLAGRDESGRPVVKKEFGVVKFDKTEGEKIHVRDEAAEKLGVSSGQLYKIDYIYDREELARDVVEKLDRGEISVHQAYEKVKRIVEPPPREEKTWKCDGCGKTFTEDDVVMQTRYSLCPDCLVDFETWRSKKLYEEL